MCNCAVCIRGRRLVDLAKRAGGPDDMAFVEHIDALLEDAETSATFWRMKFDGTWPSHDEPADGIATQPVGGK